MSKFIKINNKHEIIESKMTELDELFKCCGFRKNDDFLLLKEFDFEKYTIQFFGKNKGRKNTINTYNFNKEEIVSYGTMAVLKVLNKEIINLTKINFNEILMLNNEINNENSVKNTYTDNNDNDSVADDINCSDEESSDEELNSELEPDEYIFSSDEEKN